VGLLVEEAERGHDAEVDEQVVLGAPDVVDREHDAVDRAHVLAAGDVELARRTEEAVGVGAQLVGDEVEVEVVAAVDLLHHAKAIHAEAAAGALVARELVRDLDEGALIDSGAVVSHVRTVLARVRPRRREPGRA
jgi:hypothetical protein